MLHFSQEGVDLSHLPVRGVFVRDKFHVQRIVLIGKKERAMGKKEKKIDKRGGGKGGIWIVALKVGRSPSYTSTSFVSFALSSRMGSS